MSRWPTSSTSRDYPELPTPAAADHPARRRVLGHGFAASAFRFLPPKTKSVQPNRIIRRDIQWPRQRRRHRRSEPNNCHPVADARRERRPASPTTLKTYPSFEVAPVLSSCVESRQRFRSIVDRIAQVRNDGEALESESSKRSGTNSRIWFLIRFGSLLTPFVSLDKKAVDTTVHSQSGSIPGTRNDAQLRKYKIYSFPNGMPQHSAKRG